MSVQRLATQFAPGFDAPLLPDQFSVKAGFYTVKTIAQRNNIKAAYRQLDGFSNTMVFVSDTNRLYKLINEPGTSTTTALDWEEIILGTEGGVAPVGEWDPTLNEPALTDGGALNRNGEFYFVINAGTGYNFIDDELFEGALTEVFNGDWVISVGDKWTILRPTVTWDQITKPQSIIDYVNGTIIAHTHAMVDITGLQVALDEKFDADDTADHTVEFDTVPDADLIEVEFLKAHYYRRSEIDSALSSLGSAITFLSLTDTPSTFETHGSKLVRVTAAANSLEFIPATSIVTWANLSGQPTTLIGYGITDGVATFTNGLTRTGNGVKWGGELEDAVTLLTGANGTKALHLGGDGVVGGINRLSALEVRANYVDIKTSLSITLDSTAGLNLNASGPTGQITIDSGPNGPQLLLNTTTATFLDRRLTKKGWEYSGDYSAGYTLRSLPDKNYADTHLMGKLLPATPGAAQTNQALRWNNNADGWEFYVPGSGGGGGGGSFSFQNGITESGGIVRLGGPLTEVSTSVITGHRDFHIQSQAFDYVGGSTWLQIGGADDNNQYSGIGAFLDETQVQFTAFYVTKTLDDVAATFSDGRLVKRGIEYGEAGYESTDLSLISRGFANENYWTLNGTSSLSGPVKVITSTHEVAIGQNITTSNISSSYNFLTGLDHALVGDVGVTGSSINWATISGEFNVITINQSTRLINNASIIGGYNNSITTNLGAGNMYSPTILGTQSSIVNTAAGNITGAMVIGYKSHSQADMSMVLGFNSLAKPAAIGGFAKGFVTTYTTNGAWTGTVEPVTVGGRGAINISANSTAQTIGHGAYGNYSAILGGYDHNIPADSHQSVVLGGIGIKARAADPNNVYVPYFNIGSIDQDDALTQILVRNDTTGKIYYKSGLPYLKNGDTTELTAHTSIDLLELYTFTVKTKQATPFSQLAISGTTNRASLHYHIGALERVEIGVGDHPSIADAGATAFVYDSRAVPRGLEYGAAGYETTGTDLTLISRGYANSNYWKVAGTSTITATTAIDPNGFVLTFGQDATVPRLWVQDGLIAMYAPGPGGNAALNALNNALTVSDTRTTKQGLMYAATGYETTDFSLISRGYANSNYWKVTGTSTLTGNVVIDGAAANHSLTFNNSGGFFMDTPEDTVPFIYASFDVNGTRYWGINTITGGRYSGVGPVMHVGSNAGFIALINYTTSELASNGTTYAFFNESSPGGQTPQFVFTGANANSTGTSLVKMEAGVTKTTGSTSTTSRTLYLSPTLNYTGGSNSIFMGLDYNPTVSASTGLTHYAIRSATGSVLFANAAANTVTASTRLDVRGVTNGSILRLASDANVQKMSVSNDGYFVVSSTDGFSGGGGFVGNYTATVSSLLHLVVQPNVTGSSSTVGAYTLFSILGGLISGANTQTLTKLNISGPYTLSTHTGAVLHGIHYDPSITGTPGTHYAIRTGSGSVLFGAASANTLTANTRVDIRGIGTTTNNILRLADSANATRLTIFDDGRFTYNNVSTFHTPYEFQMNGLPWVRIRTAAPSYGGYTGTGPSVNFGGTSAGFILLQEDGIALADSSGNGWILGIVNGNQPANIGQIQVNPREGVGNSYAMDVIGGNTASSGSHVGKTIHMRPKLNYSGGTSTFIGIDYNPTITSVAGLTRHYALKTATGSTLLGNAAADLLTANTRLDVRGINSGNIVRFATNGDAEILRITNTGALLGNLSSALFSADFDYSAFTVRVPQLDISTPAASFSATIAGVNAGEYLYKRRAAFGGFLSWPDTDITTYHTADHSTTDTPNGSGVRIPDNASSLVTVKIVARRTGGTAGSANDSAAYVLRGLFKKVAGTVTQIGSTIKEVVGESQAGWDAVFVASGADVSIITTSAADNTVDWNFEIEVMRV